MKYVTTVLLCLFALTAAFSTPLHTMKNRLGETKEEATDSVLRHVVLFKFKKGTPEKKLVEIEMAFSALPSKIPEIMSYEWGLNNSQEGHDKGFTHCFFLTFKNEEARNTYLPHPDHKAFGELITPHLEDVFVVDYWTTTL